jgi:hypothetical protein
MATKANTGGPSGLPLALIAQAIPRLSRHDLETLAERLIDRLDELDPEPDREDDTEDRCSALEDTGSAGPTCSAWEVEDERSDQPVTLNS